MNVLFRLFIRTQGVFISLSVVVPQCLAWNLINYGFLLAYYGLTIYIYIYMYPLFEFEEVNINNI